MKLYKSILTSIVILNMLSSCTTATNSTEPSSIPTPDIGADVQKDKYLEVLAPDGWNSFNTNTSISLEIRNVSENQITSGPDFGVRIFIRTDKEWIEVKNKAGYEYQLFTLDPTENYDPRNTAAIGVRPDLPDNSISYRLRIFVVGNLMENGKGSKKVASFIDLELHP